MLELKNIVKKYKMKKCDDVTALNNINLKLDDHGLVFILGKSGSGKSTLLNVIGGLDTFDSGEIVICGKSSKKFKQVDFDSYRNTYIGFVFQEYNMLENLTVGDNIALAMELQGKKNNRKQVAEILEKVDLKGYENRKPVELSGGQKQRVAIARALIKNPQIIMADEPTGALDSATGTQIMNMLKKLSADKLVVVVSHDRDFAEQYADRIIELSDGKVISDSDDCSYEFEETGFKKIKSKLPFLNSLKMALGSLKVKPLRLAVTILLSVASFTLFGLAAAFSSYNNKTAVVESIKDGGTNYVALSFESKGASKNSSYHDQLISDEQLKLVQNEFKDIKFYSPFSEGELYSSQQYCFYDNYGTSPFDSESFASFYSFGMEGLLNLTDNDVKSLGFKLTGHLPTKDNEIAITDYLYQSFAVFGYTETANGKPVDIKSHEDLIGRKLIIPINNDEKVFTVTGIVDTGLDDERYSNYKTSESDSGIYDYILSGEMNVVTTVGFHSLGFISDSLYKELVNNDRPACLQINDYSFGVQVGETYDYNTSLYRYADKYAANTIFFDKTKTKLENSNMIVSYSFIANNKVKTDNGEVTIMELVNEIAGEKADRAKYVSAIEQVVRKYADQINATNNKIAINNNGKTQNVAMDVSGVYIQDNINFIDVGYDSRAFITNADYTKYGFVERGSYVFLVASAPTDRSTIKDLYDFTKDCGIDNARFVMNDAVSYNIDQADDFIESAADKFIYVGLAFAVFAGAMLTNFITVSIYNRKKQIGILRAMGARSKDVFMIFSNESMIIALFNWLLASTASVVIIQVLNNMISSKYGLTVTLITFTPLHLLLILIVSVVVALVASFVPVIRISRQKPIEAMR